MKSALLAHANMETVIYTIPAHTGHWTRVTIAAVRPARPDFRRTAEILIRSNSQSAGLFCRSVFVLR